MAARGAGPTSTGWISTGMPSASALRQNGSSGSSPMLVFSMLDEMITPHAPIAMAAFEFVRGGVGLRQRHRADPGEAVTVVGAPFRQRVVEHPVPGGARLGGQAITEDVGPGADDLQIDALLIEPGVALRHRFDQPRKERTDLEAVVEMQRGRRALRPHQPHADVRAARVDGGDQLRRHVVGVNVDRHEASLRDVILSVATNMPRPRCAPSP